ncbi:MAG TPA: helical backbone metal receptor [Thermoanaerobaculia bacterium]|nr:helical backbone metal receptor [Thermoanaerobaculia bacterium]
MLLLVSCGETVAPPASPSAGPRRVITLAPNLSEIVVSLGCESSIVATDDFSDFPVSLARVQKVGGVQPAVEAITALAPDLVIASTDGSHPRLASTLDRVGIASLLISTATLRDVEAAFSQIASRLTHCASRTEAAAFRQSLLRERRDRNRRPRILYVVWTSPLYVAGRGNFLDDLFVLTGATNAVAATVTGWPQYSREALMADPADIVLYSEKSVGRAQAEGLLSATGPTEPVMFVAVNEDLFTRPGPRLVAAARELNRIVDAWERADH